MRKAPDKPDMREEYDLRGGVRGKYAARYKAGTNVVLLDPDVAKFFKSSEAVNDALRAIMALTKKVSSNQG